MATLRCEDVMTRHPRICRPTDSLLDCIRLMKEVDVGYVPICEESQERLVGVITDRDVALAMSRDVRPSDLRCLDVMTRDPIVCHADDDVFSAARAMEDSQIRRIPVVDQDYRLQGVIAVADIARKAIGRKDLESELPKVIETVSQPTGVR